MLPLNPGFVSGAWASDPPGITVELLFDTVMNMSSVPADASWELKVDGVAVAVADQAWPTSTLLTMITAPTSDPSSTLTMELLVEDPDLHSLSGMRPVLPFGPSDIFFAI